MLFVATFLLSVVEVTFSTLYLCGHKIKLAVTIDANYPRSHLIVAVKQNRKRTSDKNVVAGGGEPLARAG